MMARAWGRVLLLLLLPAALAMAFPGLIPAPARAQDPVAGETPTPEVTITTTETPTPEVTVTTTETPTPEMTVTTTETPTPEMTVTPTETPMETVTENPAEPPMKGLAGAAPLAAAPSIDLSVDPATFSFGGLRMDIPGSYEAPVTVTVKIKDVPSWHLRAEDTTPGNPSKGFLYCFSPPRNLTTPLRIWDFTLATPGFRPLGTGNDVFYSDDKQGTTRVDALFVQDATTADLSGSYALIVTFTVTTS